MGEELKLSLKDSIHTTISSNVSFSFFYSFISALLILTELLLCIFCSIPTIQHHNFVHHILTRKQTLSIIQHYPIPILKSIPSPQFSRFWRRSVSYLRYVKTFTLSWAAHQARLCWWTTLKVWVTKVTLARATAPLNQPPPTRFTITSEL